MRQSTKIFIYIGLISVVIGISSIFLAILVEMVGCKTGVCSDILMAHWIALFGVYTVPGSLILAVLYNFLFDKINPSNVVSETIVQEQSPMPTVSKLTLVIRAVIPLIIIAIVLAIVAGLFVIFYMPNQNKDTEKYYSNFQKIEAECAVIAQSQSDQSICFEGSVDISCMEVFANYDSGIVESYFVDKSAYTDCMTMMQSK